MPSVSDFGEFRSTRGSFTCVHNWPCRVSGALDLKGECVCVQNAAFNRQRWIAFLAMFVGYAHPSSPYLSLHSKASRKTKFISPVALPIITSSHQWPVLCSEGMS